MSERAAHNPHDRLVKWIFSRPEAAAVELRRALPPRITARLDWASLTVVPGSFVDRRLSTRHCDILFTVGFRASSQSALVYVLLEHQSSPDRLMAWRLLRYVCRIWERCVRDHGGQLERLPLVIPVLLYHGPHGWTQPRRLSELLDIPAAHRAAFDPPIELVFTVDELRDTVLTDPNPRDGILALVEITRSLLRLAFHPEEVTPERVAPLAPLFDRVMATLGIDDVHALWSYVISAFHSESPFRDMLIAAASEDMQQTYTTYYDEAIAEGKSQGLAEGKSQGLAEGKTLAERALLLHLLERRGLTISDAVRHRIESCSDEALLLAWFDRALTAATVHEIFDGPCRT